MSAHRYTESYDDDFGLCCAYRQWCGRGPQPILRERFLRVDLAFEADDLSGFPEVLDPDRLADMRGWLWDTFGHTTLVAADDPALVLFRHLDKWGAVRLVEVEDVGCRAFARLILDAGEEWLHSSGHSPRIRLASVTVTTRLADNDSETATARNPAMQQFTWGADDDSGLYGEGS